MKGVLFTITIFIIMGLAIIYFSTLVSSNSRRANYINEELASQRIYYIWMGVYDNFQDLLNVSVDKEDTHVIINDTLPASEDKVKNMLTRYQQFVDIYIKDPTISIRFEDASGNKVDLNATEPKIVIKPMNINYSWPNYGKREMFLKATPENFSFIRNITFELTTNEPFEMSLVPNPKTCPSQYCLNFTLRVKNSSYVWEWDVKQHDLKYANWAVVKSVAGGTEIAKVDIGSIDPPANIVVHVDIIKPEYVFGTSLDVLLNTSQFYIDFPTKLNVSSAFGKKVDWL